MLATDGTPVRGYVTFYAPMSVTPEPVRVRASGGVAMCTLPRMAFGYTIGAVVEDECVVLESYVKKLGPEEAA